MAQETPRGAALAFYRGLIGAPDYPDGCIIWPYARNRYGYAVFGKPVGTIRSSLVARVVCYEVSGPPPSRSYEAAHTCGNGHSGCVNPRHLKWKTSKENKADQIKHGTRNRGERNGNARLTAEDVRAIRVMAKTETLAAVAGRYSINKCWAREIVRGNCWRHVS